MNDFLIEFQTAELLTNVELYALSKPQDIAKILGEWVEYGERCPLELLMSFSVLAKTHEVLRKNTAFMAAVEREIERTKEKGNKAARFCYAAGLQYRTDYDFTTCKDPFWDNLQGQKTELDKAIKDRETYLKTLIEEIGDENSEGFFVLPPLTKTKTIVSIT